MYGDSSAGGGMDAGAVLGGMALGTGAMLILGLLLGAVAWQVPLGPYGLVAAAVGVQGLGALVGGISAGRRAAGSGFLHGALTGLALAGLAGAVQAIAWEAPGWLALVQRGAMMLAAGGLGGIAGINLGRY